MYFEIQSSGRGNSKEKHSSFAFCDIFVVYSVSLKVYTIYTYMYGLMFDIENNPVKSRNLKMDRAQKSLPHLNLSDLWLRGIVELTSRDEKASTTPRKQIKPNKMIGVAYPFNHNDMISCQKDSTQSKRSVSEDFEP